MVSNRSILKGETYVPSKKDRKAKFNPTSERIAEETKAFRKRGGKIKKIKTSWIEDGD